MKYNLCTCKQSRKYKKLAQELADLVIMYEVPGIMEKRQDKAEEIFNAIDSDKNN